MIPPVHQSRWYPRSKAPSQIDTSLQGPVIKPPAPRPTVAAHQIHPLTRAPGKRMLSVDLIDLNTNTRVNPYEDYVSGPTSAQVQTVNRRAATRNAVAARTIPRTKQVWYPRKGG